MVEPDHMVLMCLRRVKLSSYYAIHVMSQVCKCRLFDIIIAEATSEVQVSQYDYTFGRPIDY